MLNMARAWTQLALGFFQITGATFSVYFLFTTGPSRYTKAGIGATAFVTALSLFLKHVTWKRTPNKRDKDQPLHYGGTYRR
jgi:hypothetical protein